ncbi:hypothetical protein MRB53_042130 [Persea americana]|nr:hypothetical protein MRB53_042130 [Persea americana]
MMSAASSSPVLADKPPTSVSCAPLKIALGSKPDIANACQRLQHESNRTVNIMLEAAKPAARRNVTLPTRLQESSQRRPTEAAAEDTSVETLFSHPNAKVVSFVAPGSAQPSSSSGSNEGTLAWTNRHEIVRHLGTTVQIPLLPRSQCWCVDGISKYAMRNRTEIYRIELPVDTDSDKQLVQQFQRVLRRIMQYEKTPCPFKRSLDGSVDIAEDEIDEEPLEKMSLAEVPFLERKPKRWELDREWRLRGSPRQSSMVVARPRAPATPRVAGETMSNSSESICEEATETPGDSELDANATDVDVQTPALLERHGPRVEDGTEAEQILDHEAPQAVAVPCLTLDVVSDSMSSQDVASVPHPRAVTAPARLLIVEPNTSTTSDSSSVPTSSQSTRTPSATSSNASYHTAIEHYPAPPLTPPITEPDCPRTPDQAQFVRRLRSSSSLSFYHAPETAERPDTPPTSVSSAEPTTPIRSNASTVSSHKRSQSSQDQSQYESPRTPVRQVRTTLLQTPTVSSPSADLTSSLVSKTCAILMSPPSSLVAVMLRIAARIANSALAGSENRRYSHFGRPKLPGRWRDSDEDTEGDASSHGEDDWAHVSIDDTSESEDDYGVPLGNDEHVRSTRTRLGQGRGWELD